MNKFWFKGKLYGGAPVDAADINFNNSGTGSASTNLQALGEELLAAATNSKINAKINSITVGTNPTTTKKALVVDWTESGVNHLNYIDFTN